MKQLPRLSIRRKRPSDPFQFARIGAPRSLEATVLCRDIAAMSDDGIARVVGPALGFFDDSPALVRAAAQLQAETGTLGLAVTAGLLDEARQRLAEGGVCYRASWEAEGTNFMEDETWKLTSR